MIGHFNIYKSIVDPVTTGTTFSNPQGICYDSANNRIAVCDFGSKTVIFLNATTFAVITTVSIPAFLGLTPIAYDSVGNRFFIGKDGTNDIAIIDGATYGVTNFTVAVSGVAAVYRGIVVDNTNDRLFISVTNENKIYIHKLSDLSFVTTFTHNNGGGISLDLPNNRIYIGQMSSIVVYNATTYALITTITGSGVLAFTNAVGISESPINSDILYVCDSTTNKIVHLRKSTNTIISKIGGITNCRYSTFIGNDLYVTSQSLNRLQKLENLTI